MDLAMQCLEQRLDNLKTDVKEEEKKLWSVDMDKNRKITQVEASLRKFNSELPALGITPESQLYLDMYKPVAQVRADLQVRKRTWSKYLKQIIKYWLIFYLTILIGHFGFNIQIF